MVDDTRQSRSPEHGYGVVAADSNEPLTLIECGDGENFSLDAVRVQAETGLSSTLQLEVHDVDDDMSTTDVDSREPDDVLFVDDGALVEDHDMTWDDFESGVTLYTGGNNAAPIHCTAGGHFLG